MAAISPALASEIRANAFRPYTELTKKCNLLVAVSHVDASTYVISLHPGNLTPVKNPSTEDIGYIEERAERIARAFNQHRAQFAQHPILGSPLESTKQFESFDTYRIFKTSATNGLVTKVPAAIQELDLKAHTLMRQRVFKTDRAVPKAPPLSISIPPPSTIITASASISDTTTVLEAAESAIMTAESNAFAAQVMLDQGAIGIESAMQTIATSTDACIRAAATAADVAVDAAAVEPVAVTAAEQAAFAEAGTLTAARNAQSMANAIRQFQVTLSRDALGELITNALVETGTAVSEALRTVRFAGVAIEQMNMGVMTEAVGAIRDAELFAIALEALGGGPTVIVIGIGIAAILGVLGMSEGVAQATPAIVPGGIAPQPGTGSGTGSGTDSGTDSGTNVGGNPAGSEKPDSDAPPANPPKKPTFCLDIYDETGERLIATSCGVNGSNPIDNSDGIPFWIPGQDPFPIRVGGSSGSLPLPPKPDTGGNPIGDSGVDVGPSPPPAGGGNPTPNDGGDDGNNPTGSSGTSTGPSPPPGSPSGGAIDGGPRKPEPDDYYKTLESRTSVVIRAANNRSTTVLDNDTLAKCAMHALVRAMEVNHNTYRERKLLAVDWLTSIATEFAAKVKNELKVSQPPVHSSFTQFILNLIRSKLTWLFKA